MQSKNAPPYNNIFDELDRLQCQQQSYLVYELCNGDHGIKSELHMMVPAFSMAYHTNRTFIIKGTWIFGEFNTWFKPITKHRLSNNRLYPYSAGMDIESEASKQKFQFVSVDPMTSYTKVNDLYGHPPEQYKHKGIVWWKSQLINYIMRPSDYLLKLITNEKLRLSLPEQFIGLQIRHSRNWTSRTRRNATVDEYMKLLEPIVNKTGIKTIFISTEDQAVIDELKTKKYKHLTVRYTQNQRLNLNQAKAILAGQLNGYEEGKIALLNLFIMREASHLVGGVLSNWGRLVIEHMTAIGNGPYNNDQFICKSVDQIPIHRYSGNKEIEFKWFNQF